MQGVSVPLDDLSDESCCKIMEDYAFQNEDIFQHQALEQICMQVARKIMGHPLAATLTSKLFVVTIHCKRMGKHLGKRKVESGKR